MVELIASIVFIGSVAGAGAIAARKMPQAMREAQLSPEAKLLNFRAAAKGWFAARIKSNRYLKDFSWIDFVQKQLLKARVLAMKADNKINDCTAKLRQRAENQKKKEEALLDNYWHDLKTMVKARKPLIVVKDSKKSSEINPESKHGSLVADKAEPITEREAMPEQEISRQFRSKKRHNSKKKKIKDPFQW
jgi:hypothetical protein